jgi:hypothetical protein
VNAYRASQVQLDSSELIRRYRLTARTAILKYIDTSTCSARVGGKNANGVNGFGRGVAVLFVLDMTQAGDYVITKWEKECEDISATVDSQFKLTWYVVHAMENIHQDH